MSKSSKIMLDGLHVLDSTERENKFKNKPKRSCSRISVLEMGLNQQEVFAMKEMEILWLKCLRYMMI